MGWNRLRRCYTRRMKLLLIEDDPDLAVAMRRLLARENHVVDVADSLRMGRAALTDNAYDVVLLDRRLPDGDGAQLIKFARRNRLRTRFLIVSALGETVQRVEGLDLGADDYIVKPFEPEELFARLRAAARRPLPETTRVIEVGNLALHCQQRQVTVAGKSLMLPRRELTVLEKLMERAGAVVPRDTLEGAVYGYDDLVQSNTLESHISRLRKHLADCGANVGIQSIRGVGYLLRKTAEAA